MTNLNTAGHADSAGKDNSASRDADAEISVADTGAATASSGGFANAGLFQGNLYQHAAPEEIRQAGFVDRGGTLNQIAGDVSGGVSGKTLVLITIPVILISVATIYAIVALPSKLANSAAWRSGISSNATTGTAPSLIASPSTPPSPSSPPSALTATLTGVDNTCTSVIFPRALKDESKPFADSTKQPMDATAFMAKELQLGAYPFGEMMIRLNAQSSLPQSVTIIDVSLIDLTIEDPVAGILVNLMTCGGDAANRMVIHAAGPDRRPFAVDEFDHETKIHFFDRETIPVSPGKKASFVIQVLPEEAKVKSASYRFRLALSFEVDGIVNKVVVDDGGREFRLTTGCQFDSVTTSHGATNEFLHKVDPVRYAQILCG
ncbi:hypothetical protein GCM10009827_109970 [Dactylosporangium maewongense]|uniref:Uncharacterized protein n=1 Tax=Dactylosporangium maewongense TaxID=634393 RepID=A0ABN2D6Q7_9ACTN